jgi:hypothetical protein
MIRSTQGAYRVPFEVVPFAQRGQDKNEAVPFEKGDKKQALTLSLPSKGDSITILRVPFAKGDNTGGGREPA